MGTNSKAGWRTNRLKQRLEDNALVFKGNTLPTPPLPPPPPPGKAALSFPLPGLALGTAEDELTQRSATQRAECESVRLYILRFGPAFKRKIQKWVGKEVEEEEEINHAFLRKAGQTQPSLVAVYRDCVGGGWVFWG